jgi:hypothetical protein
MLRRSVLVLVTTAFIAVVGTFVYSQQAMSAAVTPLTTTHATTSSVAVALRQAAAAPTPVPRRGFGRIGSRDVVTGRWISATARTITVQGFSGNQTLTRASTVIFYTAAAASLKTLKDGQKITARLGGQTGTGPASSITIAPTGNLYGIVTSFRGFGGPGNRPSGRATPIPGSPTRVPGTPAPGFNGGNRGFRALVSGTILALHSGAIDIKTTLGKAQTIVVNPSTVVYGFRGATSNGIKAGTTVSVTTAKIGASLEAIAVVESTLPNTTASLTANP